jgi:beta-glucosidase/6-phospho-beta-glucosidase/beta-galactosidase
MRSLRLLASLLLPLGLTGCPSPTTNDGGYDAALDTADAMAPDDVATPDVLAPWLEPYVPAPRAAVPTGFLWGSATAAYQIEGGLENTNWGQWEARGRIVGGARASDGPKSLDHVDEDVGTLVETHQNAYRFGIEWARLFPTREAWERCRTAPAATRQADCRTAADADGLAYYDRLLAALRAVNIKPLVTLQHFTLPSYVDDLSSDWMTQGWMRDAIAEDLALYAGFVAGEFGDRVDWWVTINEPLVVATVGYLDGRSPPGQVLQIDAILRVIRNMVRAHAGMYDAIHRADTTVAESNGPIMPLRPAMVSIAHHVRKFYGANPADVRDTASAVRADYLFNRLFLEAVVHGNLDANGNGTLDAGEPANDESLRGRLDYLGINYYSLTAVATSRAIPLLGAIPQPDERERGLPKTDFGWDIHPRGFHDTLVWAGTYGLPVVVTENGIADATDANRPRYLAEHLAAMGAAIQQGVRVVGYFHWSTIDNFEWVSGYCPRFGLYAIDFGDPARPRVARPSAMLYRQIIEAGEVSDALLAAQPAYRTPTAFCTTTATTDGGM